MDCPKTFLWCAACVLAWGATAAAQTRPETTDAQVVAGATTDEALGASCKYIADHADRYLDHRALRRGTKGYGLTVLSGTEIVRFGVEIVSVVTGWGPHQDVILARLSGQGLEKTGIIAGMSGSPCYVRDADGKDKLIGAVAYGWSFPKEPLCGIQPIAQMLAVRGVVAPAASTTRPADSQSAGESATAGGARQEAARPAARSTDQFLRRILDPRKLDFLAEDPPAVDRASLRRDEGADRPRGPRLESLATPLMVRGLAPRARREAERLLAARNFVAVQGGGVGAADAQAAAEARLTPGSAVAVPLISGDVDISAVGTVTEVIGDKVLIFGHEMLGEGRTELPMAPAFVHTVVPGVYDSFKLASALKATGALFSDEYVGAAGAAGRAAGTIPVTVNITWAAEGRTRKFRYEVARHRWLTPRALRMCVVGSAWSYKDLPLEHTVRHEVRVDFAGLGAYAAKNLFSDDDVMAAVSDMDRAVSAMADNPFAAPCLPKSVQVDLVIEEGDRTARILDLKLDGRTYRPGDTVRGKATLRPFRQADVMVDVSMKLPDDLPEGSYTLTACDAYESISRCQARMPQRYRARTAEELFAAVQAVVEPDATELHLDLPLDEGGLSLGKRELPTIPEGKASLIAEARLLDIHTFGRAVCAALSTRYVVRGEASAAFIVEKKPRETILHP